MQLTTTRFVTVVGPPGIGKTRVAIEYARTNVDQYASIVFVPLANAVDLGPAIAAVGDALDFELPPLAGLPLLDAIAREIDKRGSTLLILDNFEQLVESCSGFAEVIAAGAPQAHVLVTSRHRLRIGAEWVLQLDALGVGASGSAVALLEDRIRRQRGRYAPSTNELGQLQEIATRLEGVPLALELAAVRISTLGAATILDRLDEPLAILTEGLRGGTSSGSLRQALERSWQLLTDSERAALASCAIFRGSFDVDAAIHVLSPDDPPAALDALHDLREKSLVVAQDSVDGSTRFSLYENIREFGAAQLDASKRRTLERRHASWYVQLAEGWIEALAGRDVRALCDALAAERENLLAVAGRRLATRTKATDVCEEAEDRAQGVALAMRALLCLVPLAAARGPIGPLVEGLDLALAQLDLEPPLRVRALLAAARGHRRLGNTATAHQHQASALELAAARTQGGLLARIKSDLSMTLISEGQFESAPPLLLEALAARDPAQDPGGIAMDHLRLGLALRELGRLVEAETHLERAFAMGERGQNHVLVAVALGELAHLALDLRDQNRARAILDRGRSAGERAASGLADVALTSRRGMIAHVEDDLGQAATLLQAALIMVRRVGYRRFEAGIGAYLGVVDLERDALDSAWNRLSASRDAVQNEPRARDFMNGWLAVIAKRRGVPDPSLVANISPLDPSDPLRVAAHRLANLARDEPLVESAASSHDVALVDRVARGLFARDDAAPGAQPLLVASSGDWFVTPDGTRATLRRHRARRLILLALVERRLLDKDRPLSREELVAAGWPGEQIQPEAARNRLKTAMSSLRKLGLRELIDRDKRGYRLDAATPVVVISE